MRGQYHAGYGQSSDAAGDGRSVRCGRDSDGRGLDGCDGAGV